MNTSNTATSSAEEILKRLVDWYDASKRELDSVYVLAHVHGFRSTYTGADPLSRIVHDSKALLGSVK